MNGSEHLPEHAPADTGSALDVAGILNALADKWAALDMGMGMYPEDTAHRRAHEDRAEACADELREVAAHVEALREADRAAAWDEGYREAIEDYGTDIPWGGLTSEHNPYRSES